MVTILLAHGAKVEHQNENGHTPLMEAASCGHVGESRDTKSTIHVLYMYNVHVHVKIAKTFKNNTCTCRKVWYSLQ